MTTITVERTVLDEPEPPDELAKLAEGIRREHARIGRTRERIEAANREQVAAAIEAGAKLIAAKRLVEHGGWAAWVADNCEFSMRTAQLYMTLGRDAEKAQRFAHLGIAGAVGAIAALRGPDLKPETPWTQPFERARSGTARAGTAATPKPKGEPAAFRSKDIDTEDYYEQHRYDLVDDWTRRRSSLVRRAFIEAVGAITSLAVELADGPDERARMDADLMAVLSEVQVYADRAVAVPWATTNGPPDCEA